MRLRNVKTIFFKELIDVLRDRRTLISMILLPILVMPGIMMLVGLFVSKNIEREKQQISKVVVLGDQHAPDIVKKLKEVENIRLVTVDDPKVSLKDKSIHAILEIPANFTESLE